MILFSCTLFIYTVRMLQSWVLSSSAQRATATLFQKPAAATRGEAGGAAGSHWRLRRGSLFLCVSRIRSRASG